MLKALLQLFFPELCAGCENLLLANENVICSRCRHDAPLTNYHLQHENEAFRKFYGRIPVENVNCLFYFHKKGTVQQLIHKLKYKDMQEIGTILGHWFAVDLRKLPGISCVDAIIPVPLHPKKLRQRGYNQVTTFGKALSSDLGITFNDNLLSRNLYSRTQTRKNLLQRSVLDGSLFTANYTENDHSSHFLIVDDVLTTGSTLEACARALLEIPGAKVSIACIAFSHS